MDRNVMNQLRKICIPEEKLLFRVLKLQHVRAAGQRQKVKLYVDKSLKIVNLNQLEIN